MKENKKVLDILSRAFFYAQNALQIKTLRTYSYCYPYQYTVHLYRY